MSKVSPSQVSFNGGELSKRLRARSDQAIYTIAVAEMTGFAPLVEGAAEAMPGFIHVAQAPGPCRLIRFEFNTTQGHVLEFTHAQVRVYTNDALLTNGENTPVVVGSPYSFDQVQELSTHQSYDVLYCFHPALMPREFQRTGPLAFSFVDLVLKNGPFDPRNDDESVTVTATALIGDVTLTASSGIFAATDVGSLFKMEAGDFGDIPAWEPGITVSVGDLLTASEKVYRVAGGSTRTGTLIPSHTEGVEWDGIGRGNDVNGDSAGGVQLEYIHDRIGIVRITEFTSPTVVKATVERHLPFSAVDNNYGYDGGYWDPGTGEWIPPSGGVEYVYGTWRWAFGAFSDTRGWPTCGVIWDQRLCLGKGSSIYASVAGDLRNFATLNEFAEQSADMAFIYTIEDPNRITALVADDKLLALTASGVFALGPSNAAAGVGPNNVRADRQNNAGAKATAPVLSDSRTLYIDRSERRIYQADYDSGRNVEQPEDLTRYARHIGKPKFLALAAQQNPFNMIWALRGDGSLACAAYLPAEQVLGFATRQLAEGMAARSLVSITDPDGLFDQIWIAAEYNGAWHVLRMAPWREDGDSNVNACMVDMAAAYEGEPRTEFTHPVLPEGTTMHVVADGRMLIGQTEAGGVFTLPEAAGTVVAGLPFPAAIESLDLEAGGDDGAATGKMGRAIRPWVDVLDARGLRFGVPADKYQAGDMEDLELLQGDSVMDQDFGTQTGICFKGMGGAHTRNPRLRIERIYPAEATIRAWGTSLQREGS